MSMVICNSENKIVANASCCSDPRVLCPSCATKAGLIGANVRNVPNHRQRQRDDKDDDPGLEIPTINWAELASWNLREQQERRHESVRNQRDERSDDEGLEAPTNDWSSLASWNQ